MAQVDSANLTLTVTTIGDNESQPSFNTTTSVSPTNPQVVAGNGITVGTGGFINIMGGISGSDGLYVCENTDDTNFLDLKIFATGSDCVYFRLNAGRCFIMNGLQIEVSTTAAAPSGYSTVNRIDAQADTADVVVNIYKIQPG